MGRHHIIESIPMDAYLTDSHPHSLRRRKHHKSKRHQSKVIYLEPNHPRSVTVSHKTYIIEPLPAFWAPPTYPPPPPPPPPPPQQQQQQPTPEHFQQPQFISPTQLPTFPSSCHYQPQLAQPQGFPQLPAQDSPFGQSGHTPSQHPQTPALSSFPPPATPAPLRVSIAEPPSAQFTAPPIHTRHPSIAPNFRNPFAYSTPSIPMGRKPSMAAPLGTPLGTPSPFTPVAYPSHLANDGVTFAEPEGPSPLDSGPEIPPVAPQPPRRYSVAPHGMSEVEAAARRISVQPTAFNALSGPVGRRASQALPVQMEEEVENDGDDAIAVNEEMDREKLWRGSELERRRGSVHDGRGSHSSRYRRDRSYGRQRSVDQERGRERERECARQQDHGRDRDRRAQSRRRDRDRSTDHKHEVYIEKVVPIHIPIPCPHHHGHSHSHDHERACSPKTILRGVSRPWSKVHHPVASLPPEPLSSDALTYNYDDAASVEYGVRAPRSSVRYVDAEDYWRRRGWKEERRALGMAGGGVTPEWLRGYGRGVEEGDYEYGREDGGYGGYVDDRYGGYGHYGDYRYSGYQDDQESMYVNNGGRVREYKYRHY